MSDGFQYLIPSIEGDPISVSLEPGQMLFVLGANGTGKSTLLHKMTSTVGQRATRLSAHRQIWFHSNSPDILASQRDQSYQNLWNNETSDQSRYMDNNASTRNQVLLFDFIRANEKINSEIANAARTRNTILIDELISRESPLQKLNRLLAASNLRFSITLDDYGRYLASRTGFSPYSITELSDGERAALVVILTVLNLPPKAVAILDEPERHLHKSIVSPMLTSLLLERKDVIFIVSTHDVSFAIDQPNSKALLLRQYDKQTGRWDYDVVEKLEFIPEDIALAVLGGRRKLLFVEGEHSSLDLSIYSVMLPGVSVFPAGPSKNVAQMARGISKVDSLHRILAFGLIDGDHLTSEKKDSLKSESIFACGFNSVESLYYCTDALEFVAEAMSRVLSRSPEDSVRSAIENSMPAFGRSREKLASLATEAAIRDALLEAAPSNLEIMERAIERTSPIEVRSTYDLELAKIDGLIAIGDYESLIARYSVKRSGIRSIVATTLGFASTAHYEEAVRSGIVQSAAFASKMRAHANLLEPQLLN